MPYALASFTQESTSALIAAGKYRFKDILTNFVYVEDTMKRMTDQMNVVRPAQVRALCISVIEACEASGTCTPCLTGFVSLACALPTIVS